MSTNIASHLVAMAAQQPTAPALFLYERSTWKPVSFQQLNDRSGALATGFRKLGITPGARTALCVRPGLDFFAITFALFKLGAVPVLIDPGIGLKNFGRCLDQAKPAAFIGIPLVHALRRTFGWTKATNRINITTGSFGGTSLHTLLHPSPSPTLAHDASAAAILFTSGSTGPAKGVLYTHANFQAQIDALKSTYNIQPGEIDLATFPLFGLFGPALGMAAVIPVMDFTRPGFVNPRNILDPIRDLHITNMFGSPALLERVSHFGKQHNIQLPSLKRVISAGAPASARTLARFASLLSPTAQIFTPYGATEALPVSSVGSDEILHHTAAETDLGKGVCVGKPVDNITARIIAITDAPIKNWSDARPLPPGQIGEIVVHGPVVTSEYFERPDATALAKIPDPAAHSFWHRMGDVGYLDDSGRLWFCGRKSQRIQLPTGDLFTTPFEAVFNTHPAVARSALVAIQRSDKKIPLICIELTPEATSLNKTTIEKELLALAQKHPHTRIIENFLFHPRFPVDIRHNAKINREQLAVWAQRKLP